MIAVFPSENSLFNYWVERNNKNPLLRSIVPPNRIVLQLAFQFQRFYRIQYLERRQRGQLLDPTLYSISSQK